VVLVIDAKNDRAAKWYASYGAVPLRDAPLSLLLPLATIQAALKKRGNRGMPNRHRHARNSLPLASSMTT